MIGKNKKLCQYDYIICYVNKVIITFITMKSQQIIIMNKFIILNNNEFSDIEMDLNCEFPSDRGRFPDIINNSNLKRQIIAFGPCKPDIKFPLDSTWCQDNENKKCRKFSVEYYFTTNLAGQKIPRSWLCYSVILDKAYCESCWLFSDRTHPYFKSNWIKGINDWRHLSQKINKHEISI